MWTLTKSRWPRVSALKDLSIVCGKGCKLNPEIQNRWASSDTVKSTCLLNFHKSRGARLEPFANHTMPIVYKDQSIRSEHMQTRDSASAFDVSHMMQTIIRGRDRYKFIENLTVADVQGMGLDKCTLSVFTNESGGIIDDCIISNRKDHIFIVSNAGNAEIVWSWLNENKPRDSDVSLERLEGRGLIALQGPKAAKVLQDLVDVDLTEIEFMNTTDANIRSVGLCQITRCGYTGEDGFEISIGPELAEKLMEILCQRDEVLPAGLGARDTLRLEAGLCLHGHDITDKITPVESALNWTIHKRRRLEGGFLGSNIVLDQLKNKSKIKRIGLVAVKGGPPAREGSSVFDAQTGTELGTVTSGTLAPKLCKNIAMAYVPIEISTKIGYPVHCVVRGKKYEYELAKMPFVKSNYYFKKK